MEPILIGTDYLVYLAGEDDKTTGGLYDELAESYVSDGTVTAKLYQDTTQIGDTISMSYVADHDPLTGMAEADHVTLDELLGDVVCTTCGGRPDLGSFRAIKKFLGHIVLGG